MVSGASAIAILALAAFLLALGVAVLILAAAPIALLALYWGERSGALQRFVDERWPVTPERAATATVETSDGEWLPYDQALAHEKRIFNNRAPGWSS